MGRHDWYRNEGWDGGIEADFRARLARARQQKPQYLMIQAGCLADRRPDVALALIDEYFALGDAFFRADALVVRGRAHEALGEPRKAVAALREALDWEREHSGPITTARLDYPRLVALNRLKDEYEAALEVLVERFEANDLVLPGSRYRWNGAHALILHEQSRHADARHFAERALAAASETQSPYPRHRTIGLVETTSDEFGRRIKRIAQPSAIRRLLRLTGRA